MTDEEVRQEMTRKALKDAPFAKMQKVAPQMFDVLKNAETALFYIRNLAKNANFDQENLPPTLKRIFDYAENSRMEIVDVLREAKL